MSQLTRNENCHYCFNVNSTSIVSDIHYFIGNVNICIATMMVPLDTMKSNPTGTAFELKLILFSKAGSTFYRKF